MTAAPDPWPALDHEAFAPTSHLLHMGLQAVGKLMLRKPFEPQWANVAMPVTSRGLTTGPIPWDGGTFSIDVDLVVHEVAITTSWGRRGGLSLGPTSVADLVTSLFDVLRAVGVEATIDPKPQEVADPIPFPDDTVVRPYDHDLAHAWWQIVSSTNRVLQRYHARFAGKTPPVGFFWGTFDLRDARFNGQRLAVDGPNAGYIRRNAMNEAQAECGFWPGTAAYPRPAYYAFTFPQPPGVEDVAVRPAAARWDPAMGEFVVDHDDIRASADPDGDLLAFFESTYAGATALAGWDPALVVTGEPEPAPVGGAGS